LGSGAPVWITRAHPGAAATAQRVAALGFTPVVDPLLAVEFLAPTVTLAGVTALAFTSVNGVQGFVQGCSRRDLPVFAVGAATAMAAKQAGFAQVRSADGDVAALERLIVAAKPGSVLWAGAQSPAGDLVAGLRAQGLEAKGVAVYATVERVPSGATLALLAAPLTVLIHSPRAARALAALLKARPTAELRLLCLSAAVSEPFVGVVEPRFVALAPRPDESALLQLLTA
jgi:uroporphyrinogen-III synthase